MTLSKFIGSWVLLALVSVSTFFSSPGLSGLVLCLGQDGHLELEYSIDGKCGTTSKASHTTALHSADGDSHCGTCTDVPLIGQGHDSLRQVQSLEAPQSIAVLSLEVPAAHFLRSLTVATLPQPPQLASPHLVHLLTVRLLV